MAKIDSLFASCASLFFVSPRLNEWKAPARNGVNGAAKSGSWLSSHSETILKMCKEKELANFHESEEALLSCLSENELFVILGKNPQRASFEKGKIEARGSAPK